MNKNTKKKLLLRELYTAFKNALHVFEHFKYERIVKIINFNLKFIEQRGITFLKLEYRMRLTFLSQLHRAKASADNHH